MLPGSLSRVDEQAPAYCHPADPKALFDGIHHNEASVHSALNHPRALEECLKRTGVSPAEIANKIDPDGDRRPLHWAAARGHTQCVQLLLEAGADPQALDVHGATAAQLGMWHEECSALLPSISAYPAAAAIVAAQVAAAAASCCATRSDSFGTSGSCQTSGSCSSSGAASSRSSESRLRPGMKQMPDGRVVMTKAAKKREARARREAEAAQREAREDDCLGGALLEALGDERPVAGDSIGGRGRFTAEEDAAYLALLNQFGRPKKKENPEAWAAFGKAFPNRSPSSWTAHINAFSQAPSGLWQKRTIGPAERRKAPSGGLYTKAEFVALYGGRAEWDAAAAGAVGPAAPAALPGAGGGGRLPHTSGSWWPPLPVLYQPPISQGGAQAGSSRALPPVSPAVARKLEWWVAAKRRRDFVTSDQLRAEIMRDAGFNPEDGRPVPGWLPPGPGWFAGGYV